MGMYVGKKKFKGTLLNEKIPHLPFNFHYQRIFFSTPTANSRRRQNKKKLMNILTIYSMTIMNILTILKMEIMNSMIIMNI